MFEHDLLRCCQAQASAVGLGGKERLEQLSLDVRGDAHTGVVDSNHDKAVNHIGLQLNRARSGYRFDCVPSEVIDDLSKQLLVKPYCRSRRCQLDRKANSIRRLETLNNTPDDILDSSRLQIRFRKTGKLQVLTDDSIQSIEFSQD